MKRLEKEERRNERERSSKRDEEWSFKGVEIERYSHRRHYREPIEQVAPSSLALG